MTRITPARTAASGSLLNVIESVIHWARAWRVRATKVSNDCYCRRWVFSIDPTLLSFGTILFRMQKLKSKSDDVIPRRREMAGASARLRRSHACLNASLVLWLGLLAPSPRALGQTIILSEDFEGAFPADNRWGLADLNPSGARAFWARVNPDFGG